MPLKWSSAFCGNHNGLLARMEKQKIVFFIFLLELHFSFPSGSDGPYPRVGFWTARTTTTEQETKTNIIYSPLSQMLAENKVPTRLVFSRDAEGEPVPRSFSASGGLPAVADIPYILSIHLPHPTLLSPTWYSSCMHFSMQNLSFIKSIGTGLEIHLTLE